MVLSKKIITAALTVLCFGLATAQIAPKVKYWVKFTNKSATPYSLSNPTAFLTQKSIDRRSRYNIPLHPSDLPVDPVYIGAVNAVAHVKVIYASKWINGVVVSIDSASVAQAALATINSFTFVQSSNQVKKFKVDFGPVTEAAVLSKGSAAELSASFSYGGSGGQNRQLKVNLFHEKGYRGQGMVIAVLDAGFDNVNSSSTFDSIRNNGGILGTRDFVNGAADAYYGSSHGTMVFSCMAANRPGTAMGTAPLAKYWLLRTEEGPSETISEEFNWVRGAEFADSVGADILTTSLGYTEFDGGLQNHTYATLDGRTAPMSIASTMAARKGMFVLNAAGNEGDKLWKYVSVPGDADSICTVGAVDTSGVYAGFSSVGPTADGRIKPDLVACGAGAWVCDQSGSCFGGNGTSFATPVLAGAVACYWQANRSLNNIQLLDTLKKTASNAHSPNNKIGWGIPNMKSPPTEVLPISPDPDFDFTVYANPANSHISIKLTRLNYSSVVVDVLDPIGKLLLSSTFETLNNNSTIDLNAFSVSDGIYLVKVKTSKGSKVKKFLKQ